MGNFSKKNVKKIMITDNTATRKFKHTLGDVTIELNFRTDIKQQLKDGREILKTILSEIEEEIIKK